MAAGGPVVDRQRCVIKPAHPGATLNKTAGGDTSGLAAKISLTREIDWDGTRSPVCVSAQTQTLSLPGSTPLAIC